MIIKKKETLAQVFSCEFSKIFKNTFFIEHLRVTASGDLDISFSHFHFTLDFFTLGIALCRQDLNNFCFPLPYVYHIVE